MNEDSTSGPIETFFENSYSEFSNFSLLYQNSHSILYKAQRYGRNFILKCLTSDVYYSSSRDILKKEFELTLQLDHPNIVRVYSYENIPGKGECIVMEYVDAMPLDKWLLMSPSVDERKRVYLQLLDAVSYIHSHQIVHRDLKPSNILITRNGNNVKLIDFGYSDADSIAIFKSPAGTYKYMSPEQRDPNGIVDARSDIYTLGILLDEILPNKYVNVVGKCKKKDPAERYQNVHQLKLSFLQNAKSTRIIYMTIGISVLACLSILLFNVFNNDTKSTTVDDSNRKVDTIISKNSLDSLPNTTTADKSVLDGNNDAGISSGREGNEDKAIKINIVKLEAEQTCKEITESYNKLYERSEYAELYLEESVSLYSKYVLEFYRNVVNSNWTPEEYFEYYTVFEANKNAYADTKDVAKTLPSYSERYYDNRENSPKYDSLEKVRRSLSVPSIQDSIVLYNKKFYKWSVLHLK